MSSEEKSKKKLTKIAKELERDLIPRKLNYEHHRSQFDGRNSYSKTDPDATFMRMKEDHMRNGQLKPGYNIQIGTENGFVTSFASYPNPTDTRTLKPFLDLFKDNYGSYPENYIADKGYGSAENYETLEDLGIEAFIKYPHWEQEKKKRSKKYRFKWWKFSYDEEDDEFTCPEGKKLSFEKNKSRHRYDGSLEKFKLYRCKDCSDCPVRNDCTRADFRSIEFNIRRHELQQKARQRLQTDEGWEIYRKRGSEVETVFGQVKGNWGFKRFTTMGQQNIACEWGLNMMAYNLKTLTVRQHQ